MLKRYGYKIIYTVLYRAHRQYSSLFRPYVQGAYVLCLYKDQILLIKNSYKRYWTLPCGGISKNETPIEAAIREAEEEVGLFLDPEQLHFLTQIISTEEYKEDRIHLFTYTFRHKPRVRIDNKEVEDFAWVNKTQLAQYTVFKPIQKIIETALEQRQ